MSTKSNTVLVVGAGLMGTGIAYAFAASSHHLMLVDTSARALDVALGSIDTILVDAIRRGKMTEADRSAARARVAVNTDLRAALRDLAPALVIETATEALALKKEIIALVEPLIPSDSIIATNTSALSVTEISAGATDPSRIAGMHFFNPVQKMKLVELVRGLATSDATITRLAAFSAAIGKTSIVVNEAPGLTTSRMSALLGNEAMYMLMEGTASAEDIDVALRLGFNHPMGPLELGDLTGWDTRLAVLKHLHATLGEKFRPCPLISKLVTAGRFGRKAGRGIYDYIDGVRVPGSGLKVHVS
jgi:3-hydroxybutyryl-CoA dehydrogenase